MHIAKGVSLGNYEGRLTKPPHPLLVEAYHEVGIRDTKFTFRHLLRYHKAYVIMLVEQGIVASDEGVQLIRALREIEGGGLEHLELDPLLEDIHPNLERELIKRTGYAVGGNINLGRSRGEIVFVSEHLALREEFLGSLEANLSLRRAFLGLSDGHLFSVMPYYTWIQQAEPITLAYYLASYVEEFEHHYGRLLDAYKQLNICVAGVGQIVPSTFPVNRQRLAELLGYTELSRHSLFGYYNVEPHINGISALALMAATLSRLTLDFYIWASNEFNLVTFGDEFCQTSFIMPQKKNPLWLLPVRPAAMKIKALYDLALDKFLHTTPMELGSVIEIPLHLHEAIEHLTRIAHLTAAATSTMQFHRERGKWLAEAHYAQAVQIMSRLVGSGQVSWREAHLVMGSLIRRSLDSGMTPSQLTVASLEEASIEAIQRPVRLSEGELANSIDALEIIKTRRVGGPAPDSVREALIQHEREVERDSRILAQEHARLETTWRSLDDQASAMAGTGGITA